MRKVVVWTSWDLNFEDWREMLERTEPSLSEDERVDMMYTRNDEWLETYLKPELDWHLQRQIIAFTECRYKGRTEKNWNMLTTRLSDVFIPSGKYVTYYLDERGDMRMEAKYPDYTERVLFRELRTRMHTKTLRNTLIKWQRGYTIAEDFTDPIGQHIMKALGWRREA